MMNAVTGEVKFIPDTYASCCGCWAGVGNARQGKLWNATSGPSRSGPLGCPLPSGATKQRFDRLPLQPLLD
jgi:hypothetical protein